MIYSFGYLYNIEYTEKGTFLGADEDSVEISLEGLVSDSKIARAKTLASIKSGQPREALYLIDIIDTDTNQVIEQHDCYSAGFGA